MLVKEFFEKYNIQCPNWLERESLEDDLIDSDYSFEDNVHKWRFKNNFKGYITYF